MQMKVQGRCCNVVKGLNKRKGILVFKCYRDWMPCKGMSIDIFTYGMNPTSKECHCMHKKQGGLHNLEYRNIVKETKLDAREGERISWDEVWLMDGSVISMRNHGNVGRRNC